jgi:dCMP deaminase
MILSWDQYFISVASLSSLRSKHPHHKAGACIVNDKNRIVAIGYNGMPTGIDAAWTEESEFYVCHAAMNSVINKNQDSLESCTLYCTHFPCNECAKIITQSGIKRVVYAKEPKPDCVKAEATRMLFGLIGISLIRFRSEINLSLDLS